MFVVLMLRKFDSMDDHSLGPTTLKLFDAILNLNVFRLGKALCLISYEGLCRFLINNSLRGVGRESIIKNK